MWLRKNKPPKQGRDLSRQVQRNGRPSPAFSYYANSRSVEPIRDRPEGRQEFGTGERRRLNVAQIPFWFVLALVVVCGVKLLMLGTNPKVIVVDKHSAVAATYLQSTEVYATAAHKLLASSITNRTKLTANLDGIAARLRLQFPELQEVSLDVPLMGSRPIVYVQVAQPSLVLQTAHGNFALNKTGVVLAKLQTIPADVPLAVDQSHNMPHLGAQYLPSSTIDFVQTIAYQLNAAHMAASAFVLPTGSPYELDVRLSGQSYYVRCNLQADALTQSGAVVATVQQLGAALPQEYLDVRVPGRVYYK
jgi:hypothetical protein